jgi:tetratricopeptide (TPR) repeat protein
LRANDFTLALEHVDRARACAPEAAAVAVDGLHIRVDAYRWLAQHANRFAAAWEAWERFGDDPRDHWPAAEAAVSGLMCGETSRALAVARKLVDTEPATDAIGSYMAAVALCANRLRMSGHIELASAMRRRYERFAPEASAPPLGRMQFDWACAFEALQGGDLESFLGRVRAAIAILESIGDERRAVDLMPNVGYAWNRLGHYEEGERVLRDAKERADRLGLGVARALARNNLGTALLCSGQLDAAEAVEREAVELFVAQGDRRLEAGTRTQLARVLVERGDAEQAWDEADRAYQLALDASPPLQAAALAARAEAELALWRSDGTPAEGGGGPRITVDDAVRTAGTAWALVARGEAEGGELEAALVRARALGATRDPGYAEARGDALRIRDSMAARIRDPEIRARFLRAERSAAAIAALPEAR